MNPIRHLLAASLLIAAPAVAAEAHVHGQARLSVAVDGATLTLVLETPTESLVGFEHAPRTPQQRQAVDMMRMLLNMPAKLFQPTPAAACTSAGVKLASPLFDAKPKHDGHADLDGEFVFRCAQPGLLRDVEVNLFDPFPGIKRLNVEVAAPTGQKAVQLGPKQRKVSW